MTSLCNWRYLLLTMALVFYCSTLALAVPTRDDEAPVWIEMSGEAIGSEYDPPKEVMERARNDAKRKAIDEAVGSFVRAHTLVSNSQVAEDFVFARVKGKIEKTQILKEERDKNDPNICRVRLKVLVRPLYPKEGEGIHVKISLSKDRLKEGDEVRVVYQANVDSYIHIFSIGADNSVTLLFPNSMDKDNHIKANQGQVFPPDGSPIKLQAMSLPEMKGKMSQEKVKIIATRQREFLLERGFTEGIFQTYDAKQTGLVGDLARRLSQLDPADWGEALAIYTIEP